MIVGWIAGCLSVLQLVPQILRLYKIKNARQISRWSLGTRVLSHLLYILHAWSPPFDPPLFWMTSVGLFLSLTVCVQIAYYDDFCALVSGDESNSDSMSFSTSSHLDISTSEVESTLSTNSGSKKSEKGNDDG